MRLPALQRERGTGGEEDFSQLDSKAMKRRSFLLEPILIVVVPE